MHDAAPAQGGLVRTEAGAELRLFSARDAETEADGWLRDALGKTRPTALVCISLGGGHLLHAIDRLLPHVPVVVLEPCPDLYAHWSADAVARDWMASGRLAVSVGPNYEDAERVVSRIVHPRPKLASFVHPVVARARPTGVAAARQRVVDLVRHALASGQQETFPVLPGFDAVAHWYEAWSCEPTVALALRDFCRPGDVVFDVGANVGDVALQMSRLVGPRGVVCAFEASPRNIPACQRTLVLNGCSNVQLHHAAVHSRTGEPLSIFESPNGVADSLFGAPGARSRRVRSLALDDYVRHTGLVPAFVKMDIEGAEFEALQGFEQTITRTALPLVLELGCSRPEQIAWLCARGYRGIDLATYAELQSVDDVPAGSVVRNVLYLHESRIGATPFGNLGRTEYLHLAASDFIREPDGTSTSPAFVLPAGRYIVETEFSSDRDDTEMFCGIAEGAVHRFRYHGNSAWLARSYREWPIQIAERTAVSLFFQFVAERSDPDLRVDGARIVRLDGFSGLEHVHQF